MRIRLIPLIWKINAIIIFILGVLALLTVIAFNWVPLMNSVDPAPASPAPQLPKQFLIQENWRLNLGRSIPSSGIVTINLVTDVKSGKQSLGYKLSSAQETEMSIRNVLFFNQGQQKGHWLFENNDNRDIHYDFLYEGEQPGQKNGTIHGVRYLVRTYPHKDDPDKKAETESLKLVYTDTQGNNPETLVENIDRSIGYAVSTEGILTEFFIEAGVAQAITFDTRARKTLNRAPLM